MPGDPHVTKESFRAELQRLVANFAANEDELTFPGFTEMQARTQFITPFFRALGWGMAIPDELRVESRRKVS